MFRLPDIKMSTTKLFPSTPHEPNTNVEARLEKKRKDKNSSKNSIETVEQLFTWFKNYNRKPE